MRRQASLQSGMSMAARRQPLLSGVDYSSRGGVRSNARLAEVAGGTAAECAAVCCCCPCGLVDLLVLAVYKVPAGLCRKALRKKRRRKLMKMGVLPRRNCHCDEHEVEIHPVTAPLSMVSSLESGPDTDKEVIELDKEMLEKFFSGGFWRSSSRRNEL
ncbi:uncharacterized protein LOC105161694 [Sesamum indicum]|uniref:Uncharacterized protein LOC105161694 n=1 Tax=Sesamum indicum TaxID=4182 RepID=A0A8M8V091_SESIN|nr:uncharacterized protein LOC105161694 [Sesamum indicum]